MIIAIDPGSSGGIVVRHEDGIVDTYKMPPTEGDITDLFRKIVREFYKEKVEGEKITCFLEKVGGFTGVGQPGSAMFKFGDGYGYLKANIRVWRMVLESVTPQTWIKTNGLGKRGSMTKTQWKNKLKDHAQRIYPDIKVTLYLSDTLLILEHGLRVMGIKK